MTRDNIAVIRCACLLPLWIETSSLHPIFSRVILSLCLLLIYTIESVQMMYSVFSVFVHFVSVNHKVCAGGRVFHAGQTETVSGWGLCCRLVTAAPNNSGPLHVYCSVCGCCDVCQPWRSRWPLFVTYISFLAPDSGGGSVAVLLRLAIDPSPVVESRDWKEGGVKTNALPTYPSTTARHWFYYERDYSGRLGLRRD
jgi:hypothetical protein